jgi:hypothetical protein
VVIRTGAARVISFLCWWATAILFSYKPLHCRISLICVHRYRGPRVIGVVDSIRSNIADALHMLECLSDTDGDSTRMKPTSTCSLDHESILNDLTFVICVPIFRCKAAHRIHRNIPNYFAVSKPDPISLLSIVLSDRRKNGRHSHSNLPILFHMVSLKACGSRTWSPTWISGLTIGTNIIPWQFNKLLESHLVARKLPLA